MVHKSIFTIILAISLALAGCSGAAQRSGATHSKKASQITAESVILQTNRQNKQINNMAVNSSLTMDITSGSQKSTQKSDTKTLTFLKQPLIYQSGKITINENGSQRNLTTESYVDTNTMYTKSSANPNWGKLDLSGANGSAVKASMTQQQKPGAQLEILNQFKKDLSLKTTGKTYTIYFKGNAKETEHLLNESLAKNLPGSQGQALKSALSMMKYQSMNYSYAVDRKTFYPVHFTMEFTAVPATQTSGSETIHVVIVSDFSQINQLKKIAIPDTVVKTARPLNSSMLQQ